MNTENPLRGTPRIHGELLKLGFEVAESTVSKYMIRRRGSKLGSDAILVHGKSNRRRLVGPQEIELSTSVHLAFRELELCDLALHLAVGPWQCYCRTNGGPVVQDPVGE
jgi:hypothetical protein